MATLFVLSESKTRNDWLETVVELKAADVTVPVVVILPVVLIAAEPPIVPALIALPLTLPAVESDGMSLSVREPPPPTATHENEVPFAFKTSPAPQVGRSALAKALTLGS